jgi:hypothetical protein
MKIEIIGIMVLAGFFSIIIFGTLWMIKSSRKFWVKYEELEVKLKTANTIEEVTKLHNEDFQALIKLSMGHPHLEKLNYICGLLKGKYEVLSTK